MIPSPGQPGEGWSRLSPRKMLLDPVKAVGQAVVPVVVALVGISQSNGATGGCSSRSLVIAPIVFGTLPWLTTHYRLTDSQLQVRKGLLNKSTSTAPLDRVRSVDLEASLIHRILGLQKVQVGTGVDDDRITLDALAVADAHALRTTLLRRARDLGRPGSRDARDGRGRGAHPARPALPSSRRGRAATLAAIDWSWLRFAPFSLGRLVIVAGAVGVLSQFGDNLPIWNEETATSAWSWITQFAIAAVVVVLAVGALGAWLVISVAGYVVQWWNFRLVREHGSLHLTSGLFTTRSITVEEAKVRGVVMTEPVLMRGRRRRRAVDPRHGRRGRGHAGAAALPTRGRRRCRRRTCSSTPARSPIRWSRTARAPTVARGSASCARHWSSSSRPPGRPGGSTSRGGGWWPCPWCCSRWPQ